MKEFILFFSSPRKKEEGNPTYIAAHLPVRLPAVGRAGGFASHTGQRCNQYQNCRDAKELAKLVPIFREPTLQKKI
ncbi:MAG: hypothetical protein COW63_10580 [Bacteroidetes bacterium CG18_big_fil_WC_8_21_14_2_50_41_14]|nr:MAG: hypothetical protein COW63_10580 [Bacteroidetes bacterium CG18_big_fil_WC_8_21_14_2_50_41_14]PJB58681.1 MAG: hypothetical protein CO098_07370 [Bacteroidetes bacterium CG_4_9_14_3_um_filter_41_19]